MIALSHQTALRRRMDVVANNIANMNTTAFKAEQPLFAEYLIRSRGGESILGEKLSFVHDLATVRDTAEGAFQTTGNPLDVAIHGEGYFAVETPEGEQYTRNGHFRLDPTGQMVTEDGHPVMAQGGGPIFLAPTDTEITISADGLISSENGEIARLRIVRFDKEQSLQMVEAGLMIAEEPAIEVDRPDLAQGMLEGSNVQGVLEMTRMIDVHRSYERTKKLISREDERIRNMIEAYAR